MMVDDGDVKQVVEVQVNECWWLVVVMSHSDKQNDIRSAVVVVAVVIVQ